MIERRKKNHSWVIITVLAVLFSVITLQVNALMEKQTEIISDLSQVEYLSSSTQRLSRMVLVNDMDEMVLSYIDSETWKYFDERSAEVLSVLEYSEVKILALEILGNWNNVHDLITEVDPEDEESTYDHDSIKLASDNHFNSMTDLSLEISKVSADLNDEIHQMQQTSYSILVLILFFLGNYLISSSFAMRKSAELNTIAALDIATGLYNRSKCQDLFKDTPPTGRDRQPVMLVIDLNDLKKTNDKQGHRVGDDLIISFAQILKEAIKIHQSAPFVGRYGGDEFVVYHRDVAKEEEILSFIKELTFLTDEFNKAEKKKFTVSYALGYAINLNGSDALSLRQLFDEADENMYANKRALKKKQAESADSENR